MTTSGRNGVLVSSPPHNGVQKPSARPNGVVVRTPGAGLVKGHQNGGAARCPGAPLRGKGGLVQGPGDSREDSHHLSSFISPASQRCVRGGTLLGLAFRHVMKMLKNKLQIQVRHIKVDRKAKRPYPCHPRAPLPSTLLHNPSEDLLLLCHLLFLFHLLLLQPPEGPHHPHLLDQHEHLPAGGQGGQGGPATGEHL